MTFPKIGENKFLDPVFDGESHGDLRFCSFCRHWAVLSIPSELRGFLTLRTLYSPTTTCTLKPSYVHKTPFSEGWLRYTPCAPACELHMVMTSIHELYKRPLRRATTTTLSICTHR